MDKFNIDDETKKKLGNFFTFLGGIAFGDIKKVEKMLDQGEDVNGRIIDIFKLEIDHEDNPTIADTDTPLLIAVKSGALPEIVQLLLERGADVTVKDENGKTPLEIAKERKLIDVVSLLEIHENHK